MSVVPVETRIPSRGLAAGPTFARNTEPDTWAFRTTVPVAPIRTTTAGTFIVPVAAPPSVQLLLDGQWGYFSHSS